MSRATAHPKRTHPADCRPSHRSTGWADLSKQHPRVQGGRAVVGRAAR